MTTVNVPVGSGTKKFPVGTQIRILSSASQDWQFRGRVGVVEGSKTFKGRLGIKRTMLQVRVIGAGRALYSYFPRELKVLEAPIHAKARRIRSRRL